MLRLLTVFGTRPEALKLVPLVRALQDAGGVDAKVCVTGQHREMLVQVLSLFGVAPDADLDIMQPDQSPNDVISAVLGRLPTVLRTLRPDRVIVQGDTSTALAAALAAFHERIPVAHVEAGLRTGDLDNPFPEELNRRLIAQIADRHYAPTQGARRHLEEEGVAADRILVTGNTIIDCLNQALEKLEADGSVPDLPGLESGRPVVLVTGHRRENWGERFQTVCRALVELSRRLPVEIVFVSHPNPLQRPATDLFRQRPNIHRVPPLDYFTFLRLMRAAALIITDSGGIQEEACALNKPLLLTRTVTERPEAADSGLMELVGDRLDQLLDTAVRFLSQPPERTVLRNPFGDGHATERIVDDLLARHRLPRRHPASTMISEADSVETPARVARAVPGLLPTPSGS